MSGLDISWLRAPWSEASTLQRPLPDGSLAIVARGVKEDGPVASSQVAERPRLL